MLEAATTRDRHDQRVGHQLRCHAVAHRQAGDTTREQVGHHRDIEPALGRPDVGEIGHPFLVSPNGRELWSRTVVANCRSRMLDGIDPDTARHGRSADHADGAVLAKSGRASAVRSCAARSASMLPADRARPTSRRRCGRSPGSSTLPREPSFHPPQHGRFGGRFSQAGKPGARRPALSTARPPARLNDATRQSRTLYRIPGEVPRGRFLGSHALRGAWRPVGEAGRFPAARAAFGRGQNRRARYRLPHHFLNAARYSRQRPGHGLPAPRPHRARHQLRRLEPKLSTEHSALHGDFR